MMYDINSTMHWLSSHLWLQKSTSNKKQLAPQHNKFIL